MTIQLSKNGTVNLSKGATVNLSKEDTGQLLTDTTIGLGWDPVKSTAKKGFFGSLMGGGGEKDIDLDASLIFYSATKEPTEIIFWNNLKSKDGSATHGGDNLTGQGDGDDEQIFLRLDKVSPNVHHIAVIINSYSSQKFSDIEAVHCRIVDNSTNNEVVHYNMQDKGGANTSLLMGVFSRRGSNPAEGWDFRATEVQMNGKVARDNQHQIKQYI